ncbi:MAG: DUF975 family protein [Clostridiales bacterium]|nr:DUF975 family protein [Clostridiales bacterium]
MYRAKDYRQQAWSSLKGKWGIIVVTQLIYLLISLACDGLSRYYIGALAVILLTGPLEVGINKISLNVVRNENIEIVTLFDGFKDFTRAVVLWITNQILTFLWTLLFIIPGIIKSLSYSMSYFILLDNPQMSPNDARKKSMEMMDGNKWRLFCLGLSYIGWAILSILTAGILYLWVLPSMRTAMAFFYQSLLPEVKVEDDSEEIDLDRDVFDSDVVIENDNNIVWKDEEKSDDITF